KPHGEQIAWDDQAHWHPHVLRWEELGIISRATEIQERQMAHPGLSILFLCRFTPICLGDDADTVLPMLFQAWSSLGTLSDDQIQSHMEFVDHRQDGFKWTRSPLGWSLGRDPAKEEESMADPYTLRHSENPEFPVQALESYLALLRGLVGESATF